MNGFKKAKNRPDASSGSELVGVCPAKINLHLNVLGRRPDGYHLLNTLFAKVSWADRLIWRPHPKAPLTVTVDTMPELPTASNLVFKAAKAFSRHFDLPIGGEIQIEKNVPHGGGLGGGSSNAAKALELFAQHHQLGEDAASDLKALALDLGADVPFFLMESSAAWAGGVGEVLTPVSLNGFPPLVMVNPGIQVSTARVFQNLPEALTRIGGGGNSPTRSSQLDWASALTQIRSKGNDLRPVAEALFPEIQIVADALSDAIWHDMSGSGSTYFGFYADLDACQAKVRELKTRFPEWAMNVAHLQDLQAWGVDKW